MMKATQRMTLVSLPLLLAGLLGACGDKGGISLNSDPAAEVRQLVQNTIQPSHNENQYRANIQLTKTNLLAMLGDLDSIQSKANIFRTVFGRMSADNLNRYESVQAGEKILLSDGSIRPAGWKVVVFP